MMRYEHAANRNKQTTPPVPANTAPLRVAVLAATLILIATGAAYRLSADRLETLGSIPIVLDPPLSSFPPTVGPWIGRDVPLSDAVLAKAANDDTLSRTYVHRHSNERVNLYVAYTARPRTMLGHRPTVCYPASGWTHQGTTRSQVQSPARTIPCLVHRFRRPGQNGERQIVLNYYVLNGQPSSDEDGFSGIRWRDPNTARHPARYVAQVQIIVPVTTDPASAERTAMDFARASADGLLALLPGTDSDRAPTD